MTETNHNLISDQSETNHRVQTLLECVDELRETLNIPEIKEFYRRLLSPHNRWRQLCAALDALRDSQRAINRYKTIRSVDLILGDSLFLYGILNALYIQQDAVRIWGELINMKIDFQCSYPDTFYVREIRDDICHSSERGRKSGKSNYQIFIIPTSYDKYYFEYVRFKTGTDAPETKSVNLKECINDQERDITSIVKDFTAKISSTVR